MRERRADSNAEIASLQRQLQEAIQRSQVEESQHQTKKDAIWRVAEEQMGEADAEENNEGLGLEFTAAGLSFGDATPGDKARDWLNKQSNVHFDPKLTQTIEYSPKIDPSTRESPAAAGGGEKDEAAAAAAAVPRSTPAAASVQQPAQRRPEDRPPLQPKSDARAGGKKKRTKSRSRRNRSPNDATAVDEVAGRVAALQAQLELLETRAGLRVKEVEKVEAEIKEKHRQWDVAAAAAANAAVAEAAEAAAAEAAAAAAAAAR